MKDMFRSFCIFTGAYTIKNTAQILLTFFAIFAAMSLLSAIPVQEDSFAAGFFSSFIPGFSMFVPMGGAFLLNALYTYNLPQTQGFKYLHSIPESARKFRQAIAAANIVALAVMFIAIVINSLLFYVFEIGTSPLFAAFVSLLAIGITNLLGGTKKQWLRFAAMMPLFVGAGFAFGFSAALQEKGESLPESVLWIALGVSIVVYIAGLIYTFKVSEKKWRRE